jgi:hypothetical protein
VFIYLLELLLKSNLSNIAGHFDELPDRNKLLLILRNSADSLLHGDVCVLDCVDAVVAPGFDGLN